MKVWLVISEQRDENGNICNYYISDVCGTHHKASKKWKLWLRYWGKRGRSIVSVGKDTAVSISKYGICYIVYIEEREVK